MYTKYYFLQTPVQNLFFSNNNEMCNKMGHRIITQWSNKIIGHERLGNISINGLKK